MAGDDGGVCARVAAGMGGSHHRSVAVTVRRPSFAPGENERRTRLSITADVIRHVTLRAHGTEARVAREEPRGRHSCSPRVVSSTTLIQPVSSLVKRQA